MDTSPSCKTGGYINLCTMDLEFDVRKLISDTYFFKRHQTAPPPICRATRDQTNANSGNDTSAQPQSRRNSSRRSSRVTREQERFQGLLQELSTPAKGEAENDDDAKEDGNGSVSQSLTRLYQKATRARLRVAKAN
ncbi:uncharacterized protein OCT59_008797 [Rhizophagus irregularis]|uniref:uncharacterized protein n=1 Tax=Rhizophagus irregularis TaxID=588596 RepID=UPI003322F75A|nr:hypothetical protein OCT59_008797 [Rhizophagus irregularis]